MITTDQVDLYNRNIFKTSLYIYIFQDEKCRLMRKLSLSMDLTEFIVVNIYGLLNGLQRYGLENHSLCQRLNSFIVW